MYSEITKYVEDRKYRYLEMLQGIISRMAECSFKCKEFCILIISALLAVLATNIENHFYISFICIIPSIVFWILDTYYLTQERAFRKLYEHKAILNESDSEFENFNFKRNKLTFKNYWNTFWSKTIWPLYLILLVISFVGCVILTINHFNGFLSFSSQTFSSIQQ